MKFMTKYNLKRGLLFAGMMALPFAFGGCEKDNNEPNNPSNPDTPQKHNVELVYQDIATDLHMDTIYKYLADPKVDTVFMLPSTPDRFSTVSTNGLRNVANKLRERHNADKNRVFGKGDLKLHYYSVNENPEIVRFFADTLKYHVIYDNQSKSK